MTIGAASAEPRRFRMRTASSPCQVSSASRNAAHDVSRAAAGVTVQRFFATPRARLRDAIEFFLQSLLEDRFGVKVHKESKPLPAYALLAGKKPLMKPADGSGDTGCRIQSSNAAPAAGAPIVARIVMNGSPLNLGPDMTLQYECRNMTMYAFAGGLRGMLGSNVGNNPVINKTNIEGRWNRMWSTIRLKPSSWNAPKTSQWSVSAIGTSPRMAAVPARVCPG